MIERRALIVIPFLAKNLRLRDEDLHLESARKLSIPPTKSTNENEGTREFFEIVEQRDQTLEDLDAARLQPKDLFIGCRGPLFVAPGFEVTR